jgi:uncharacterized protein YeaO (DUF488 family)
MSEIRLKRAYDPPEMDDGTRVLVDRLWPRGVKKDEAAIDLWLKQIGPSAELRQWFAHDPSKWTEFRRRYRAELAHNNALAELRELVRRNQRTTLVFAARDIVHNNAVVLKELCLES